SLLRPGMSAAAVGDETEDLTTLMAELVGAGGRVARTEPKGGDWRLEDALPGDLDLLVLDTPGIEHLLLRSSSDLLERARPVVLVDFNPGRLTESRTDPVTVLDGYRAMGLRVSPARDGLPEDPGELVLAIGAAGLSSTTLRLEPIGGPPG